MSNLSAHLTRTVVEDHQRASLARAQAYRLSAAVRWQRRAAKAALRAERARASA